MKWIVVSALTLLLSDFAFADCPAVPISCGSHMSGTFSASCTGDFTIGDSTVTYPEKVFSISPPVGKALGAQVATSTLGLPAFGSAIFILDGSGNTLDDSVDLYADTNVLTAAIKILTTGIYSIHIASPDSSPEATYVLNVTCAATPPLFDHTMAKGVDGPATLNPVGRTTTFGSADEGAGSWVQVEPMIGIHHVIWSFIEPAGSLYQTADVGAGINDTKTYIGKAWAEMYLIHQPAGLLPGLWSVNVTLDGSPLVTEHFTLLLESMRPHVTPAIISPIAPQHGR